jgi:hypothetical protein
LKIFLYYNTNEIDSKIVINAPKKRGREPLSAEQKAENKLNREAAKCAKLQAEYKCQLNFLIG